MSVSNPEQTSLRKEYLGGTGFALFSEVNDRLLDAMNRSPLPRVTNGSHGHLLSTIDVYGTSIARDNPAGMSLHLATESAISNIPNSREVRSFYRQHGVSEDDLDESSKHTFGGGFMDLTFPWYFSAVLANHVVDACIDEGVLTREQKDSFSLGDWASVIGAGWFSRLVHNMALAPNGAYGTFGRRASYYRKGALAAKLVEDDRIASGEPVFQYKEQYEPADGYTYATVELSQPAVRGLRTAMRERRSNSIGCPVARYSVKLSADSLQHDPHVQNMVADGRLRINHERSTDTYLRATQDWSAIDKTLLFFSQQLEAYDTRYGTPVVTRKQYQPHIEHRRLPMADVLRWPSKQE